MDKLPEEIERLIFSFIPIKTLALCNKEYWIKNNKQKIINYIFLGRNIIDFYYGMIIISFLNIIYKIISLYLKKNIK